MILGLKTYYVRGRLHQQKDISALASAVQLVSYSLTHLPDRTFENENQWTDVKYCTKPCAPEHPLGPNRWLLPLSGCTIKWWRRMFTS